MAALYEDRFKGGVTVNGYSPPCSILGATGFFSVSIPVGATSIRKAYLLAGRCGTASNLTVTLIAGSGTHTYTFDNSNQVSANFVTTFQTLGGPSGVHAIDITADVSVAVTSQSYTILVPAQGQFSGNKYTGFCLAIAWNNPASDVVDTQWYVNDQNIADAMTYNLAYVIPGDNTFDVAVSLFTDYVCNNNINGQNQDAEFVLVNSTSLGHIGCPGTVNENCTDSNYQSPRGNFTYTNGILTALSNCNANLQVSGLDALSNVKTLVGNGFTSLNLQWNANNSGNVSNIPWAIFTTYKDSVPIFPYECFGEIGSVDNITSSGARVNWGWQVMCAAGSNIVQYRQVGNPTWTQVVVGAVITYDITGLASGLNYEVQIVNVNCDGAICSPTAIVPFTTI